MYLDKTKKQEIFTQFGHDQKAEDTGSAESQIALFTVHSARFPFRESARKLTFASFEMSIIPFQRSKDWE